MAGLLFHQVKGFLSLTIVGICPITVSWKSVVGNTPLIEMAMQAPTFGYISVGFTSGAWSMIGADAYWGYFPNSGVPVMQALYLGYVEYSFSLSYLFDR